MARCGLSCSPPDDAEGFEDEQVVKAEVSYMNGSGVPILEQILAGGE